MAFSLKTWVNRISEYPNRRKLTHEDGSTELVTVARAEGHISAEGNAFSAEEMNDLENRIKGGFDEVNQSLRELNEGKLSARISHIATETVGSVIKLQFSGKALSRTPLGLIIPSGQAGCANPIPFMFSGATIGNPADIKNLMVAPNDFGVTADGVVLSIKSINGGWGVITIVIFDSPELTWKFA